MQVDSVRSEFRDRFENYPRMFESLFSGAAHSDETPDFKTYDVQIGEFPIHLDECDGYVITGGKDSVYDDLPWIRELEDLVIRLHSAKKKLVGICFGHQLIANCLGGEAGPAPQGWIVGVQTSKIDSDELTRYDWMSPGVVEFNMISSHKDQVLRLPKEAKVYCESEACPIGGFSMGEHIITFQGHPEFSSEYSDVLMDFRRELLGETCYTSGQASLDKPLDRDLVGRWILNFIGG